MTALRRSPDLDITNCDREPIHIPGSIQSHGVLFACEHNTWRITHVSANCRTIFAKGARELIGTSLKTLIGAALVNDLEGGLEVGAVLPAVPVRLFGVRLKGLKGAFNIALHEFDRRRIVEIESADSTKQPAPLDLVRVMLAKLQQARSLNDLCQSTSEQLRDLIGYDRVMIYRFLQDGSGQVIAEACPNDMPSLLNLRYPASDIPAQARELYKRSWVRLISDVGSAVVPILAEEREKERPLDLSYASLRSVSPVHIEYLKNMGVGASMSISIIVGGELWGLIACHHRKARMVASHLRAAAELVGQVFSLQIQTVEGIEAYVTMRAARALLDRIVSEFPIEGDLVENLSARLEQLAAFMPCDGVGLWLDGVWRGTGTTPTAHEAELLARFIHMQHDRGIYATHKLGSEFAIAESWACGLRGVLAVPLSHTNGDWLFFFRGEVTQAIEWAGDPSKPVVGEPSSGRLGPRKSFEAWREEVRGQSLPWTSRERLIGDTLRIYLLDIIVRFSEVIMEERRQAEQRQRLMTRELNHRVKGTLELIHSLLLHGYDEDSQVKSFVRTLEGRIKAIALAHDSISLSSGSDVRSLIEGAVAPRGGSHGQIDIRGPDVRLEPKAYTVLALVVHEMATNAFAAGALSQRAGRLTVTWQTDAKGELVISWEETGGAPLRRGVKDDFGLMIIKRNIPHALGGEASVSFEPHGVSASFVIPARYVLQPPQLDVGRQSKFHLPAAALPLEGYSILILDDQMTAALDLERMLRDRGAAEVTITGTPAKAFDLIAAQTPDVAILDVDLADATSLTVADELARLGLPFIFAGSEVDASFITPQHRDVPMASKPYSGEQVAELLKEVLLPHLIRAVLTKLT